MMPAVNYEIYGWSSARRIPRVLQYWSLTLEENIIPVTSWGIDDSLKRLIKNQTLSTCRLFLLLVKSILAFTQTLCSIYIAS